jgi:archaellum component FlaD/FlaE
LVDREDTDASNDADASDDVEATAAVDAADAEREGSAYLTTVPQSYVAETTMLKWASYLVSNAGTRGAMRAVDRYRDMGWLSASVADELEGYVLGAADETTGESSRLTVEDHTTSLAYLARLAGDGSEAVVREAEAAKGGERGGIRR